ncbi:unnamed protein product [Ceratitis capitata]|uniref:(Mediterranean fruit fly) hypothetical protein n=1 Tax=Ceratitis capitata TaxID=7213 RepID=A0A811U685_CERCA|nr:unnamed protein product [Ceratitis capitata]
MQFRMNILLAADLLNIIFKVTAYVYLLCSSSALSLFSFCWFQSDVDYARYARCELTHIHRRAHMYTYVYIISQIHAMEVAVFTFGFATVVSFSSTYVFFLTG